MIIIMMMMIVDFFRSFVRFVCLFVELGKGKPKTEFGNVSSLFLF